MAHTNPLIGTVRRRLRYLPPLNEQVVEEMTFAQASALAQSTTKSLRRAPDLLRGLEPARNHSARPVPVPRLAGVRLFSRPFLSQMQTYAQLAAFYGQAGLSVAELDSLTLGEQDQRKFLAPLETQLALAAEWIPSLREVLLATAPQAELSPLQKIPAPDLLSALRAVVPAEVQLPRIPHQLNPQVVQALAAIWEFCREKAAQNDGMLDESFLDAPFGEASVSALVEMFFPHGSDWYPLAATLENLEMATLADIETLGFPLPVYCGDYPEEEYRLIFLEGPERVAGILSDLHENENIKLDARQQRLVTRYGWRTLVNHYAEGQDPQDNRWNLKNLDDYWNVFFARLEEWFPSHSEILKNRWDPTWFDGDYPEWLIQSVEDIHFVLAVYDCFFEMDRAIPMLDEANEACDTQAFVEEIFQAAQTLPSRGRKVQGVAR